MSQPPVILVTGASRGLGESIASYLLQPSAQSQPQSGQEARTKARLFLTSRSVAPLESLKSSHPEGTIEYLARDMGAPGAAAEIAAAVLAAYGRLDAIVVNHGVLDPVARLADTEVGEWRRAFDVNFFGVVDLIKELIPELRRTHGRVVFVSSGAAATPYPSWGAYGASKAALHHLCTTLVAEEPALTAAVSVRPGVIDTQMQADVRARHTGAMGPVAAERFVQLHREGKLIRPERPGNVIARLALNAPKELSGLSFIWNADELKQFQDDADGPDV